MSIEAIKSQLKKKLEIRKHEREKNLSKDTSKENYLKENFRIEDLLNGLHKNNECDPIFDESFSIGEKQKSFLLYLLNTRFFQRCFHGLKYYILKDHIDKLGRFNNTLIEVILILIERISQLEDDLKKSESSTGIIKQIEGLEARIAELEKRKDD